MTYIWVITWAIVSLFTAIPAILLIYLLYKKLNEKLLKYAFFIAIPPAAGALVYIILMLLLRDSDFTKLIYAYIIAFLNHAIMFSTMICGIYFLHKMTGSKVPLHIKIGLPIVMVILIIETLFRLVPEQLFNMTIPVLIHNFFMMYWYYLVKKARDTIKLSPLRDIMNNYLILLPIYLALGYIYVVIKNFFPHLMVIFHFFDIQSFQLTALGVSVILILIKYFFQPSVEQNADLSRKWIHALNLTPREVELVPLILKGHTSGEIGDIMNISSQTAKNYISRMYRKMGVKNKVELIHMVQDKKEF